MSGKSAIIYIDGFNLYRGICDTRDKTLLWFDIEKLAAGLIGNDEELVQIRYFTAMPIGDDQKYRRHQGFLDLIHNCSFQPVIHFGKYKRKTIIRRSLEKGVFVRIKSYEEKHSDVALGSYLVRDSMAGECESVYIISGDKDMLPAIRVAKEEHPTLSLHLRFPPRRGYSEIIADASSQSEILESDIGLARLPAQLSFSCGHRLRMPVTWQRDSTRQVGPIQPQNLAVNRPFTPFIAPGYRRI